MKEVLYVLERKDNKKNSGECIELPLNLTVSLQFPTYSFDQTEKLSPSASRFLLISKHLLTICFVPLLVAQEQLLYAFLEQHGVFPTSGNLGKFFLENELNLSSKTVVCWSSFCRDVCVLCMIDSSEPLGGIGKVVEIDEANMDLRKYNRERLVQGQWVYGGFERGSNRTFFVVVENPSKEHLLEIIQKWVLPGTTIYSDCWKAYDCLADEGFQYEIVNHSKIFVKNDTGAHTPEYRKELEGCST
ncbi:hypothetical protein NQ317_016406 [Molorchus minor]|uniref:ISXO2-like transposase domain-containing protein n=1 Tax=Molorchus minor TaxID=1323400 RepID=A0ABQ9J6S5_9CUCU|nr:hypothetical protein NQ317_016406 [Molorchus minor]